VRRVTAVSYEDFLARRRDTSTDHGFAAVNVSELLYPFQRDVVGWAARKGRAAVFADCGLGKTPMQLEWARLVHEHTGGDVLILAPLAVASQTVREGVKFGIDAVHAREASSIGPITVSNYERVARLADHPWAGVVLDESSILKALDGKTRHELTGWASRIPYRLCATATPSPNDFEELGGHSEFLGVLNRRQMLAEFFVNEGIDATSWRLKGHAGGAYWRWLRSWAQAFRSPADLGYPEDGFELPPLNVALIQVDGDHVSEDRLFAVSVSTLQERREARRESLTQRVAAAAAIANATTEPVVVWCDLNAESQALVRAIPGALEVTGSMSIEEKEERLLAFTDGSLRVLVTKPRIGGWGLNWQHCAKMVFVGLSDSYESYYQAVRRCYRFGQTRPVDVTIVASHREQTVLDNIARKQAQSVELFEQMVAAA
jgi:superfamily II DNA or RNA helicase